MAKRNVRVCINDDPLTSGVVYVIFTDDDPDQSWDATYGSDDACEMGGEIYDWLFSAPSDNGD